MGKLFKMNMDTNYHITISCIYQKLFPRPLYYTSTRGEKQFLKVFRNHTMLTTPGSDANFTTSLSDPTSHHHGGTPTSTVCLNGRQPNCLPTSSTVNSQLTLFQNLQILRTIASGHDSRHISYLGFIMTIVIFISFAHERKLYPMLCTWIKSRIVQSPTKTEW